MKKWAKAQKKWVLDKKCKKEYVKILIKVGKSPKKVGKSPVLKNKSGQKNFTLREQISLYVKKSPKAHFFTTYYYNKKFYKIYNKELKNWYYERNINDSR